MDINTPSFLPESDISVTESLYKREISRSLNISPDNVNLLTTSEFKTGQSRFLFGFTDADPPTSFPPGFVKMASEVAYKKQLQREVKSMELAAHLGIPTIDVHNGYTETSMGFGIIKLRKLDIEQGSLLANDEIIAAAPKEKHFGKRAARLISASIGKEIPPNLDTSYLIRGQKRTGTPESFWVLWGEENDIVMQDKYAQYRDKLISNEDLTNLLDESKKELEPLINTASSDTEFFVHNDTSPSNCFFTDSDQTENPDILLDFEQAAATRNLILGTITDISDFYSRAWANPDMQKEYLCELLNGMKQFSPEDRYKLVRGAAVFGTMFASQFYMEPDHPRNTKARSLLSNLKQNLDALSVAFSELAE